MISLVNFYFVLTINNFFIRIFDEEKSDFDWLVSWLSILFVVLRIIYYATNNDIFFSEHFN